MANINDNIRSKKLFKQGSSGVRASKGSDGEFTVSKEISDDLAALTDISDVFNDNGLYQVNKFLIKQIEDLREDVEELHGFIKDAFGKDSSSAASQGSRGEKGNQGSQGATGSQGPQGVAGPKGNTGSTGPAGTNGTNGAKGDKGNTGSTGPQGATGAAGSDANVSGADAVLSGFGRYIYTWKNGLLISVADNPLMILDPVKPIEGGPIKGL